MSDVVLPLLRRELKSKQKYLELLNKNPLYLEVNIDNIKEEIAEIEWAIVIINRDKNDPGVE